MFNRDDIQKKYAQALAGLTRNTRIVHGYDVPVLIEGGDYQGIWLECGPLEGLIYGRFAPEIAIANHDIFFALQRDDGYFPCWVRTDRRGSAQIQMVVPIAATAWEVAEKTGREDFLARAYHACARWDDWLATYRNTRGTGLCELFCEYDSGHDNSPRFAAGVPKKCPNDDARQLPAVGKLPYVAPDLSASMYGGRLALAQMADALGRQTDAQRWRERAETLRLSIIKYCYDPEDEFFYDVDLDGNFVKVRGDVITRVFGEHVVEQPMFERIYARYLKNPNEFWTPYPFPSISISEPAFDRALPDNSWGGASQALTALRVPRWMAHYGKQEDLTFLMQRWIEAILRSPDFMQQANPWTGEFATSQGYSPAMCVFIDFVDRLQNDIQKPE
ncbi:hypothetical protein U14_04205 [Candidatus Moduliflexus flocculans]|uniref:Mannosylglycerate hydrolase MGH1-like glycoside hydrolase domain-containing protein n=1 Tax=Candidatus Moduliflexus flocculans TaxID=1499966 RepID=A0A0S6W3E1_9BACT|nr:hypothetical protein U14_04205 [Candidatus Moduliflexus flocculans]